MGLQDFANVFSRSFVVGFFLPAFVALFAIDQLTTYHFTPAAYRDASTGAQIAVLGGTSLVIGVLLSALNYPILRLFEGYPFHGPFEKLYLKRRRRWQRKFDDLQTIREGDEESEERSRAARELHSSFPARRELVLPSRFGNALRSFETHPRTRYGLDGVAAWPSIEMLLSDPQRQTVEDALTNVAFFVNGCLAVAAVAVALLTDGVINTAELELVLRVVLSALLGLTLLWAFYNAAVGAVARWGSGVRAAFDLYHNELLERLGLKTPKTQQQQVEISRAVNRSILYAEPFPEEWRKLPESSGGDS